MSKADKSLSFIEKIKERNRRNDRRYLTVLKKNGTPFNITGFECKRRNDLQRGKARRNGEKIVGHVPKYQAGVNLMPGRFAAAASILRNFRRIIADKTYTPSAPCAYFENQISRFMQSERMTTRDKIQQLKSI